MIFRPLAFVALALVFGGVPAPLAQAHHGPPHDEIDEFDSPAARLAAPLPAVGVSWSAVVLSLSGVALAYALSRRFGVDAAEPVPARSRC